MWADHPLYGDWRGHRASSFSHSGRIIYKVEEHVITVTVVRITAAQVVRAFRTNFGLTLKELEKITGVSYPNLSAIEHGRVDVGVRRAVLLAAAFGIEPQQILFPHGYQRPEHQEAQRVRTRAKRMLEKKRHIAASGDDRRSADRACDEGLERLNADDLDLETCCKC
jgi:transcriptional regulator with XRE-family HTH domain